MSGEVDTVLFTSPRRESVQFHKSFNTTLLIFHMYRCSVVIREGHGSVRAGLQSFAMPDQ